MVCRMIWFLAAILAASLQLLFCPSCNPAPAIEPPEESPLGRHMGPIGVDPTPKRERELPPLAPTLPPMLETESEALVPGNSHLSVRVPCHQVRTQSLIEWYTEISPTFFETPDPIIWGQLDLYEEQLQSIGMEEIHDVLLDNDIPLKGVEFEDQWVRYKQGGETCYVIKFCQAYWRVYQSDYQICADRLATPHWIDP